MIVGDRLVEQRRRLAAVACAQRREPLRGQVLRLRRIAFGRAQQRAGIRIDALLLRLRVRLGLVGGDARRRGRWDRRRHRDDRRRFGRLALAGALALAGLRALAQHRHLLEHAVLGLLGQRVADLVELGEHALLLDRIALDLDRADQPERELGLGELAPLRARDEVEQERRVDLRALEGMRFVGLERQRPQVVVGRGQLCALIPEHVGLPHQRGRELVAQPRRALVGQLLRVAVELLELEHHLERRRCLRSERRRQHPVQVRGRVLRLRGEAIDLARVALGRLRAEREEQPEPHRGERARRRHHRPHPAALARQRDHERRRHVAQQAIAAREIGELRQRQVVPRGRELVGDLRLAERGLEVGHVGVAILGSLREAAQQHLLERGRDVEIGPAHRGRLRLQRELQLQQRLDGVGVERRRAGEQLVAGAAERIHVEAAVERVAEDLLGRHVVRRPGDAVIAGATGRQHRGDPEIDDLDRVGAAVVIDDDEVLRLHVAVHDVGPMRAVQPLADLAHDADEPRGLHRGALVGRHEIVAVEQLHREEQPAVGQLAEVVDLDDVARAQARGGTRLVAEHLHHLRLLAEIEAEDLQRDLALDVDVLGLVDDAHAAFAEPAQDPIPRAGHDTACREAQLRRLGPGLAEPLGALHARADPIRTLTLRRNRRGRGRVGDGDGPRARGRWHHAARGDARAMRFSGCRRRGRWCG